MHFPPAGNDDVRALGSANQRVDAIEQLVRASELAYRRGGGMHHDAFERSTLLPPGMLAIGTCSGRWPKEGVQT
jgi:hypothetical protein